MLHADDEQNMRIRGAHRNLARVAIVFTYGRLPKHLCKNRLKVLLASKDILLYSFHRVNGSEDLLASKPIWLYSNIVKISTLSANRFCR
jgi:hypothetical protein